MKSVLRHSPALFKLRHAASARALTVGLLLLQAGVAHSQVYRCGSTFQNTRCDSSSTRIMHAGALPAQATITRNLPGIDAPPSYYSKLSGHCQELNDAMRTARIRGIRSDTMQGVYAQWEQECAADAAQAMHDQRQEANQAYSQQLASRRAAEEAKLRPERERVVCHEMAVALANKERKPNLNAGEQADLQRFKESYNSRCVRQQPA